MTKTRGRSAFATTTTSSLDLTNVQRFKDVFFLGLVQNLGTNWRMVPVGKYLFISNYG